MTKATQGFLNVSPDEDPMKFGLSQLLTGLTHEERIRRVEELFLSTAKAHNNKAACEWLIILEKAYTDELEERASKQLILFTFRERLRQLYWELPDRVVLDPIRRLDSPTLLGTKLAIIKTVICDWKPELNEQSFGVYRFLMSAYHQLQDIYERQGGALDRGPYSRSRVAFPEEKKQIAQAIREHTTHFQSKHLEQWLKQPYMSDEIKLILIIARARNGGIELVERDMRNAEILAHFEPEQRSPKAIEFFKQLGKKVASLERETANLQAWVRSLPEMNHARFTFLFRETEKSFFGYELIFEIELEQPITSPDHFGTVCDKIIETISAWQQRARISLILNISEKNNNRLSRFLDYQPCVLL